MVSHSFHLLLGRWNNSLSLCRFCDQGVFCELTLFLFVQGERKVLNKVSITTCSIFFFCWLRTVDVIAFVLHPQFCPASSRTGAISRFVFVQRDLIQPNVQVLTILFALGLQYFPPDFDPAKLPKGKRPDHNMMKVRMMLPMSIRCQTCGTFMMKGVLCFQHVPAYHFWYTGCQKGSVQ